MKSLKVLSVLMLLAGVTISSCGNSSSQGISGGESQTSESASSNDKDSTSKATSSASKDVIKSLTAKNATVAVKIDESHLISEYYTLTATSGSLTAAQKICTYSSSDATIVKIVNKTFKAVAIGSATITVTSKIDTTKTCSFAVTVTDVYFDRNVSQYSSSDDFSKELPADGGIFETTSSSSGEVYVKGIESTKWLVSTTINIKSTISTEKWPKFGIVSSTVSNTDPSDNKVYYFLNAPVTSDDPASNKWTDFGVCECANGTGWAWNAGITNATARHKDNLYSLDNDHTLSYGSTFTLTEARDGLDFHFWLNDTYIGSMTTLEDLFNSNGAAANSMVGFFQFNSDVVFSNYSATADAATVKTKIDSITTKSYITEWADD